MRRTLARANMKQSKIVVTGAAGFIGSNLVKALLDGGHSVTALDNLSTGTLENLPSGCDLRKADIRNPQCAVHFQEASTVFHLAAKNCLTDCAANPFETASINVAGTARVLEACLKHGIKNFIYADTSAEYEGIRIFPSPVDSVAPQSIYACSKRGGALIAESVGQLYGLRVTTLRYFNVYGPAQDWRRVIPPVMSAFTTKLLRGESPTIYGTGEKRRDFIHVDDVNAFHLRLLRDPGLAGGTYNLGSGVDYSIVEIFDLIESEIRSGEKPVFKPELPGEAFRTLADISKTIATGWRPNVDIRAGVREFIQYMIETNRN